MCTDLFRSRRKKICGGVGGWWRSSAAKLHARSLPIHLAVPILAVLGGVALAGDPAPVIQNGMPTTVVPVFQEPGAPQFSYPAGSTSLGAGTGGATTGATSDPSGGTASGTTCSGCDPLATMMAQSWAQQAEEAAAAAGISPTALASVCVMESGCTNNAGAPASGGTISGIFQMSDGTYQQMMQEVSAANPNLQIDTSVAGKMDPGNQAYAAAQYVADGVAALENAGISNPTNAQVRDYYEFGPTYGTALAGAASGDPIGQYVPSKLLSANSISPSTTVGAFQQTILNKLGSAGSQSASAAS